MSATHSIEKGMFPLACADKPSSAEALAAALLGAVRELFTLAGDPATAICAAGALPTLDSLDARLDGAQVRFLRPPPKPVPLGESQPLCAARTFSLIGEPIVYAGARFSLRVLGEDGRFSYDRNRSGGSILLIDGIRHATVQGSVSARELESAMRIAGADAIRDHAVLEHLHLLLQSIDDRTLTANVRVKVRKMFLISVLELSGVAHLDDDLNLHLSKLTCSGQGVLSNLIASFIRPKLAQQERKPIPLTAFAMGDIRLRDVKVRAGETIEFSATIGEG